MEANEVRKRFLDFFQSRGHAKVDSYSLIPENDPSALFTTAGVQPLVPYILNGNHPKGPRLVGIQKCVRTTDIDDIGDKTHATFFEMLGNWSIGDYFKREAIEYSFQLLTDKDDGFGLDPERLYVTVFAGDDDAARDNESVQIWKEVGVPENRIYFRREDNWWSPGENGPCGPSTEMFYDLTVTGLGDMSDEEFQQADDQQKVVEIWNDVFMEYEKSEGKVVGKLPQKNVDTGAGFERLLAVLQNVESIYDIDLFASLIASARDLADDQRSQRIIADHIRTSVFIIADGISPSNTDQGYVLRRLLRRAIFSTKNKNLSTDDIDDLVEKVVSMYEEFYPLREKIEDIKNCISEEADKFNKTLNEGLKNIEGLFSKYQGDKKEFNLSVEQLFDLYQTNGFPIEMSFEQIDKMRISVNGQKLNDKEKSVLINGFKEKLKEHQEKSKSSAAGKFKGGLASTGERETKLHTATHLLHQALREVLGGHIIQKGSNINDKRLRFDFSHPQKLTEEEKTRLQELVNQKINEKLLVNFQEMSVEEAKQKGALGVFNHKYSEKVKVFSIGQGDQNFSMEICGGPHAENTSQLGEFVITKEESVSAGVRRIKATLK